jgi:uncharacterized protein (TIGR03437 family)
MTGGRLPAGILFDSSIGAIAGAPSEPGFFTFTMEVFDIYRSISSATFRMTVDAAPLTIAAAPALPAGNVGAAYQATLAASGGTPPYQFAIESGAAPDGTTLSPAGVLSGVPKQKGTFTFVARATDAASQVARVAVVVQVLGAIPSFTSASVLNGASFRPGIAPGGYISIFGTNLAAATAIAPDLPLPAAAGGVSVQWNGVALPLLSVSPGQINAQVPFDAAPGRGELTVTADGVTSSKVAVEAQAASPGLFEASPGSLLAINADGRLNAADQGAVAGTIIVFYATGGGPYDAPLHAGQATPIDRLYRLTLPCSVTIGGAPAEILFAGAAPALGSGLVQLNVRVPDLSPGTWPVVLKIGETSSNTPALSVTAHP